MGWKEFENECVNFLNSKYGNFFEHKGASDSTTSDILYKRGEVNFFVESKMSKAQSGQFVLIPNEAEMKFEYSFRNKSLNNEYARKIIEYINEHYNEFKNAGTKGLSIDMDKSVFYNWIIHYYLEKGVKYIITRNKKGTFIVFRVEDIRRFFDVQANFREKKSGSSKIAEKNKEEIIAFFEEQSISFSFQGIDVVCEEELDGFLVQGLEHDYLLKGDEGLYKVRRLSNTRNSNVIFVLSLKDDIKETDIDKGFQEFEKGL